MGNQLLERLARRPLVTDGAMGTMLQEAGLKSGQCGEQWNMNEPEKVQNIHRAYFEAGSDAVITNTFGGSRFRLKEYGKEAEVGAFNQAGAELARKVASEFDGLVLGDIGPSGQGHHLEPIGTLTEQELYAAFLEQALALAKGGVDAFIVETMMAAAEMRAAVRAAKAAAGQIPVIASLSYNKGREDFRTMMGETVAYCTEQAIEAGAEIVGANCGLGIEEMIEVVKAYRQVTDLPIIAQPNAGLPEVVGGKTVYKQTPEDMAAKVPQLIKAGAGLVGGCCGTTPEYISLCKKVALSG